MFGRRKHGFQDLEVCVALEDDIGRVQALVGPFLQSPNDKGARQALLKELARLDNQTAQADNYTSLNAIRARFAKQASSVIGATSDYSPGEKLPGELFGAQVELVKAAKDAIRAATTETLTALQVASDALAEIERREAERPTD
jgi:hypothetical protein